MDERNLDNRNPARECLLRTPPVCQGKSDSVDLRKKEDLTF